MNTDIIIPPFLKPGDLVGITCPAGYVAAEQVAYAKEVLERWGFKVVLGKTVGKGENYFAGDDAARRMDYQEMLDNPEVRAIIPGRGGYGTSRILDDLDFREFRNHPKWVCGFSDITALHSHIHQNFGIATLHSAMCRAFNAESEQRETIQSFRKALTGEALEYVFEGSTYNRIGNVEGQLVGGNLALLGHMTGSISQLDTRGKILFIEDIGEHLYHIDRLLLGLRRSGQLDGIKALLVGSFTDVEDTDRPFGKTLEELISDMVAPYKFPVAFGFPAGHDTVNLALPFGLNYRLEVKRESASLVLTDESYLSRPSLFTSASQSH